MNCVHTSRYASSGRSRAHGGASCAADIPYAGRPVHRADLTIYLWLDLRRRSRAQQLSSRPLGGGVLRDVLVTGIVMEYVCVCVCVEGGEQRR